MSTELAQHYDPVATAKRIYAEWEASGAFVADPSAPGPAFSIVIPPPNVTGSLHMGHALNNSLQDVLARWKRMEGFNVVWVPGTDHAGIATQWIVEKQLRAKGVDRRELGREKFLECVWEWKEHSGGTIVRQLRSLGVSCDWSRERFTMDETLSKAVRESFVRLHEEGLIYRASRLINWDPVGLTALSDLEVETEENVQGELWSFAYPLTDGSGEIIVATTRPETMLGDTAVAVHPEDERYKALIGKTVRHPLLDREVPIIGDAILVDPAFGTGAVKVTPAHDFNDHAVGKRHDLPMISIFTNDGKVNEHGGRYQGLDRFDAREKVKADLTALGLDRGAKPHLMTLPRSQRSGAVVEPMISTQWFVKMKPLARPAVAAVENGFTTFWPKQWENTYFSWLRDIQDWCISRQLWWGHRIPAWHCAACGNVTVTREDPTACSSCGSDRITQDEDVLDTWFSSALWPFSTFGWPEKTDDLARYYPTSVLITGFDIIFFWVARMMFAGIHQMGAVPFKDVYIHGLVRDERGDKMSKTKGNVVDPLQAIDKHGADAFRIALVSMAGLGRDLRWQDKVVESWDRFQNKVWQAFRFLHMHVSEVPKPAAPGPMDEWILARTGEAVDRIRTALELYRFDTAVSELHAFVWYELCDWYLEFSKGALYGADGPAKDAARHTLWTVFHAVARMLHPFMPFLAEELWQKLPGTTGSVMKAAYPKPTDFVRDPAAIEAVAAVQAAITEVRRIRADVALSAREPLQCRAEGALYARIAPYAASLQNLASFTVTEGPRVGAGAVGIINGETLFVGFPDTVDLGRERDRLTREITKTRKSRDFYAARIANEEFMGKAPDKLREDTLGGHAADVARLVTLEAALEALG